MLLPVWLVLAAIVSLDSIAALVQQVIDSTALLRSSTGQLHCRAVHQSHGPSSCLLTQLWICSSWAGTRDFVPWPTALKLCLHAHRNFVRIEQRSWVIAIWLGCKLASAPTLMPPTSITKESFSWIDTKSKQKMSPHKKSPYQNQGCTCFCAQSRCCICVRRVSAPPVCSTW